MILAGLFLVLTLRLWRADPKIPFAYEYRNLQLPGDTLDPEGSGDAFFGAYAFTKSIRDNGWVYSNPYVGMPTGLDFRDYPLADSLHLLLLKLLGYVTPNFGATVNLYFLLTFPLTVLSTLFVFRSLKFHDGISLCLSLLYAFLPYHFLRGEQHLFLASYYLVPPMLLVVLWVLGNEPLLKFGAGRFGFTVTRKGALSFLICLLTGSAGVYYALFECGLLGFASCLVVYRNREVRRLIAPTLLTGTILFVLILNFTPCFWYRHQHGTNPAATERVPMYAELHGLKLIQLLMPVRQHRIKILSNKATFYYAHAPLNGENSTACLGFIGGFGFLALLAWRLGLRVQGSRADLAKDLSLLNLIAFLAATTGGIGSVVAFGFSPMLRGYNRLSIFIALFAFLSIAILLEKLQSRLRGKGFLVLLSALGLMGLADQTTDAFVPLYAQNLASYQNDEEFVSRIEALEPKGAMILQLPYLPFPESTPNGDYQLFRGYLHSHSLRWSYGSMKGREADTLVHSVILAGNDWSVIVQRIRDHGFAGIYVDRAYYPEHEKIEETLRKLVDPLPLESRNGRLAFYNLLGKPN